MRLNSRFKREVLDRVRHEWVETLPPQKYVYSKMAFAAARFLCITDEELRRTSSWFDGATYIRMIKRSHMAICIARRIGLLLTPL